MLTREEAREKTCPYRIAVTVPVYYQAGGHVTETTFMYENCVAEDCPKWVDGYLEGREDYPCPEACENKSIKSCAACPNRYGRCGG